MRWGDYLCELRATIAPLMRGTQAKSASEETEAEIGVMCFEDGGSNFKPRNTGGH